MTTTFGIIPTKLDDQLTFGNVVNIAKKTIGEFLEAQQIHIPVTITFTIHDNDDKYSREVKMDERFFWKENEYALFSVSNSKTGTDAYCAKISDTLSYWDTYLEDTCGKLVTAQQITWIKKNNTAWYFRRSAGQSALTNIAYGHLAAALAELTDGVLFAEKGWDTENFPAKADTFRAAFFRPEKTNYEPGKKWFEKSLNKLRESETSRKR